MKSETVRFALAFACVSGLVWGLLVACGDDTTFVAKDASAPPGDGAVVAPDGAVAEAGVMPRYLLAVQTVYTPPSAELVVWNAATASVAARHDVAQYALVSGDPAGPFVLESLQDRVIALDSSDPTKVRAVYDVRLEDAVDGGKPEANVVAVTSVSAKKAYVLRNYRNHVAVIDLEATPDGSPAAGVVSTIDLSGLLQVGDSDGKVDMSASLFDAKRNRLYVALGNLNPDNYDMSDFAVLCAPTKSTVVAIDTTTDTLVNLGGSGPGGSIELEGRSPAVGGFVLDDANDRALVLSSGCKASADAGTVRTGRLVESVSLATGARATLLDLSSQEYPSKLLMLAPNSALVQLYPFSGRASYAWSIGQPVLGAQFPVGAEDHDAILDPEGARLLGVRMGRAVGDAGRAPEEVFSAGLTATDAGVDAATSVLGSGIFSKRGDSLSSIEIWSGSR